MALDDLLAAKSEFDVLNATASERVTRQKQYRDEGNRARELNKRISVDTTDYGRRPRTDGLPQRHNIPLPLGKAMTVKHSYRIAGALPDIIVDQRDESPEERHRSDTMEKIAWAIARGSRAETTYAAAAWNASEIGSGCFDLYMDYSRNMPIFRSIDPVGVFEVQGVDDPHDFQRVYRTWSVPLASLQMECRGKTFRGAPIDVRNIPGFKAEGGVEMTQIVQLCDAQKRVRFALGGNQVVGLFEEMHNYGFVPYVIVPNIGPYEEVWGWADYEFIRSLAAYISQLFSREADVLKAVAAGAYQEDGTGVSSTTIAKVIRDGGVVSKKRGSTVEPIQPADMPSFAENHADRAMQMMKMLGFAPDAAWGLPGSGSGTDRGLQLQPLLEYTAMKQLNWQNSLSRLYGMAYRMMEKKMVGSSKYRGAVVSKNGKRNAFSFIIGPSAKPIESVTENDEGMPDVSALPMTPKDLFDKDYEVRFVWRNRVDPEDPQYVASELNKFQTGVQSLETTLENLGVQAPEDEMRRIEKESERFPWINDGRVRLLLGQMSGNAQGNGGGAPPDTGLGGAMDTFGSAGGGGQSGALNTDALTGALAGGVGTPYGAA